MTASVTDEAIRNPPYRELEQYPWRVRRVAKSGPMLGYIGWTTLPPSTMLWAFDRATGDPMRPWRVWMSDFAGEREMHQIPVQHASGHVVVAGLGMGLAAWEMCHRPEVERVTVLEQDPAVISLWHALEVDLPKLTILQCDALVAPRLGVVDLLYADIWLRYGQRQNVADTQRMVRRLRPRQVYFWGQEHNVAGWAREQGKAIDTNALAEFSQTARLPLLGVGLPGYLEFIKLAVNCLEARTLALRPPQHLPAAKDAKEGRQETC